MSIGLILFTLADSTVQPEFNHTGELWHANIVMQCFYKGLYGNLAPHKNSKLGHHNFTNFEVVTSWCTCGKPLVTLWSQFFLFFF